MPEDVPTRKVADSDRRGNGPRPLAAALGRLATRALGRRGFAEAGLITDWAAIVGPELAATCQPDRLSFPPGKREGGALRILVAGGAATELQHLEPVVLERINSHFGYRAVARLVLAQGPAHRSRRKSGGRTVPKVAGDLAPEAQQRLDERLAAVGDPEIRAALTRLGRAILGEDARRGRD